MASPRRVGRSQHRRGEDCSFFKYYTNTTRSGGSLFHDEIDLAPGAANQRETNSYNTEASGQRGIPAPRVPDPDRGREAGEGGQQEPARPPGRYDGLGVLPPRPARQRAGEPGVEPGRPQRRQPARPPA